MNPIIFLILVISLLVFVYKIQERMPKEICEMFSRLTRLLPSFEEKADFWSMIFFCAVLVFILLMFKIIF